VYSSALVAADVNWVSMPEISGPFSVTARVRYRAESTEAVIERLADARVLTVFAKPQRAITPGQSVVWYKEDLVVGGGRIETPLSDFTPCSATMT